LGGAPEADEDAAGFLGEGTGAAAIAVVEQGFAAGDTGVEGGPEVSTAEKDVVDGVAGGFRAGGPHGGGGDLPGGGVWERYFWKRNWPRMGRMGTDRTRGIILATDGQDGHGFRCRNGG
jgi:hypothetical protein